MDGVQVFGEPREILTSVQPFPPFAGGTRRKKPSFGQSVIWPPGAPVHSSNPKRLLGQSLCRDTACFTVGFTTRGTLRVDAGGGGGRKMGGRNTPSSKSTPTLSQYLNYTETAVCGGESKMRDTRVWTPSISAHSLSKKLEAQQ